MIALSRGISFTALHESGLHRTVGIAKSVFQVHGVDTAGQVVIRRKLKRRYATNI